MARAKRPAPSKARRRPSPRQGSDALPTALTQTLRVVLKHFCKRGVTQIQLHRAAEDAIKTFDQPNTEADSPALAAMQGRIDFLATWHRDPRFLDDDGKSKRITPRTAAATGVRRRDPPRQPDPLAAEQADTDCEE